MRYLIFLLPIGVAGDLLFRYLTLKPFDFLLMDLELAILGAALITALFISFILKNQNQD